MHTTIKAPLTGVAVAGVPALGAGTVVAAKPSAEILGLRPVENGAYEVARITPFAKDGAERWRVRAHFPAKSNGGSGPFNIIDLSPLALGAA